MGRNRGAQRHDARESGSGGGMGNAHVENRGKKRGCHDQKWQDPQWWNKRLKQLRKELYPQVTVVEAEWVNKIEGLKTNDSMQELVVRENIGQTGGERLQKLAAEANLYFRAYGNGRRINTVFVVSKVPLPNFRPDLHKNNGSRKHKRRLKKALCVKDYWVDKIEGLKTNEGMQELVVRERIGHIGGELLQKLAAEANLYFDAYNKGKNTVFVVSKVPLPNYRPDLDKPKRYPEVACVEDEWVHKIEGLKTNEDMQELVVREKYDRGGEELLKKLAAEANLYFHAYDYQRGNTVSVVSKVPLPNYRADLDKENGSRQREIQMSTDMELLVEHELANFRNSGFASSSTNANVVRENDDGVGSKRLKIEADVFSRFDKEMLSKDLKNQQQRLQASTAVKDMLVFREKLPAYKMRAELLQAVSRNQVLVVSGETGCGKTTQLPQFILEHEIMSDRGADCNIICTQPRRISAISVAARVATERGDELGATVGYQIRLESKHCWSTRLLFCTTGVLLRRLIQDPMLKGVSHVLVDEIHERGINEDFLIIVLRDLLPQRPDLHLVLMSATINADLFSTYFSNARRIHIPGYTFPVMQLYLEDVLEKTGYKIVPEQEGHGRGFEGGKNPVSKTFVEADIEKVFKHYSETTKQSLEVWRDEQTDLSLIIEASIEYICKHEGPGAILVFLSGWVEISKLIDRLKMNSYLGDANKFLIIPLHGLMPTISQREIFQRSPSDVRKIVVATNIAETSITIDDVVYVLDCGKCKETSYDALNKLACLLPTWISKASALQRKGRAGRVQPGVCYHLYPKIIYDAMLQYQLPEILRTPLQQLCLQIKSLRLGGIAQFLSKALQPPEPLAVKNAIELLVTIGALNEREELTPLGRHLATLPLDPKIGKMLIMGAVFQCLGPALTIASTVGYKSPFVLPLNQMEAVNEAKKRFAGESYSDHIAVLRAFEGWQHAKREGNEHQFCSQNFLSSPTLRMIEDMRLQFLDHLSEIGFYDESEGLKVHNNLSDNLEIVRAILCAGFFPSIVQCKQKRRGNTIRTSCFTKEDGLVNLHPGSVNLYESAFPYPWLVYNEKVRTKNIYIYDSSNISDYAVLMFGGSLMPNKNEDGVEMLEGYLQFSATKRVISLVQDVRRELDALLQRKIEQPQLDIHAQGKGVVNAVLELLKCNMAQVAS